MRWQCKVCNGLLGNVIFTDRIEVLRFSFCPDCDRMVWQKSTYEELNNQSDKQCAPNTENKGK